MTASTPDPSDLTWARAALAIAHALDLVAEVPTDPNGAVKNAVRLVGLALSDDESGHRSCEPFLNRLRALDAGFLLDLWQADRMALDYPDAVDSATARVRRLAALVAADARAPRNFNQHQGEPS